MAKFSPPIDLVAQKTYRIHQESKKPHSYEHKTPVIKLRHPTIDPLEVIKTTTRNDLTKQTSLLQRHVQLFWTEIDDRLVGVIKEQDAETHLFAKGITEDQVS
jgi:hypothetical protein